VLDLVWFVLACAPIVAGLILVLFSIRERSRAAIVSSEAGDPTSRDTTRSRVGASEVAECV
jgi:hypothetical protein